MIPSVTMKGNCVVTIFNLKGVCSLAFSIYMNVLDMPHMYVPELFKDKLCNLQIVPRPGQSCIEPTRVIFSDTNEQRYKTSNCTFLGLLLFGKVCF